MVFTETAAGIAYTEPRIAPGLRLLIVGVGALMFWIPYPFLLHGTWSTFSTSTVVAAACVVLPPLVGALFIRIGLVRRQQVQFDSRQREIVSRRSGLWRPRVQKIPFDDVERIKWVRCKGVDDPDVFEIVIWLRGRPRLRIGAYDTAEEASLWRHRLHTIIEG